MNQDGEPESTKGSCAHESAPAVMSQQQERQSVKIGGGKNKLAVATVEKKAEARNDTKGRT